MLGFSTYAEAPFASLSAIAALGYLATTSAQLATGTVTSTGLASIVFPSATSAFTVNAFGDVDAKATTQLLNAIATFNISSLAEVTGKANSTLPVATANFDINSFSDVDAKANTTLSTVLSTFNASALDFSAEASITSNNVTSSFAVNDFSSVTGKANITPSSTSATFNLGIGFDAKANVITSEVTATLIASQFEDVDAKANITTGTVAASLVNSTFEDVEGQARSFLSGLLLTENINLDDPISVNFPYQDYADSYERSRAVYIVTFDDNKTVHILPETKLIHLGTLNQNRTVHVQPENRTVYLRRDNRNYTVHIAA